MAQSVGHLTSAQVKFMGLSPTSTPGVTAPILSPSLSAPPPLALSLSLSLSKNKNKNKKRFRNIKLKIY